MQIKNAKGVGLINVKGVATMQIKNRFFCPQYSLHVLTSDVVSLLPLPDSTRVIVVLLCIRYCCGGRK